MYLYTTTVVYRPRFIRNGYSYSPQFAYNIIEVMYNDVCITLVTGVIIPFVTVNGHECTTLHVLQSSLYLLPS